MTQAKKRAPIKSVAKTKPKATAVKSTAKAKPAAKRVSPAKAKTTVKVTTRGKVAVKPTPKTVAKRKPAAVTTKTASTKLTEVEKLKLQIKKLRASLKEATTENELQQKQIVSLTRKNANLSRKLDTPLIATKPKTSTKAKPITLSLPETPKKPRSAAKPRSKQQSSDSNNEQWVDKWWDTF